MTLITRISRLFRADLHAVLDRIEEPQALLRQALREMEEALARDAQALRVQGRQHEAHAAHEAELAAALRAVDGEIDLCFASGEETLARGLVKRKLEIGRGLQAVAAQRAALEAERAELQARIAENQGRLDTIRQKADALDGGLDSLIDTPWAKFDGGVSAADVEVAWLREKQNRRLS